MVTGEVVWYELRSWSSPPAQKTLCLVVSEGCFTETSSELSSIMDKRLPGFYSGAKAVYATLQSMSMTRWPQAYLECGTLSAMIVGAPNLVRHVEESLCGPPLEHMPINPFVSMETAQCIQG